MVSLWASTVVLRSCALLCYVQHDTRVCVFVVFFVCCVLCDVVIITAGGVGEATPAGGRVAKGGTEGGPGLKIYNIQHQNINTHSWSQKYTTHKISISIHQ